MLKYCPKPCGGRQPCIRTCLCGRGFMSNENGKCEPMSEMVKLKLNKTIEYKLGKINYVLLTLISFNYIRHYV